MKKFTLSFFLTIFIAFFSQSQTIWSSGNGSSASPFLIENTENLLYLAQNVNQGEKFSNTYFKLTNDIDLGCDENNPWLPIGDSLNTFNGHFDGDNHFITNIYINDSSHDNTYTGLFGNAYNATIHNVHLKEGSIIGQRIVGGICGNISGGTEISYCSNSCYIRGIGSVGGIAGSANSSYINRCVNTGSISAPGMSGGIVGNIFFINTTALEYCINSGYIKDMNFASAGISGQTFTDVKYCISIGSIDETRSPYAVAFKIGPVSNISNCFYDNQIISFTDAANIPGLNTAQLSGSALQNKIGQNSNWVFTDGLYPRINGIENISTSIVAATPTYLYYNGSNNYDNADNVIHDFNINTGNNVIWNSSNENSLSITGENVQVICQETVNNVTLTATKDNSKKDVMLTNKKVQTYNYDTVIICSTDLPLQYNDTLLIPAGAEDFQTDITSVNANGCTHHNITFFDITSYTTDIYVDTCNYYTWNGITYTTSNNYTQQFETGSGCDSVVTLHLTVNPTYAVTDNVTICQSELPYYYAPTDTTFQVGTPTLSIIHYPLSTIHGCDSIVTLHLTVNPTYAITDNVTICQSELPYYYAPADTTFQVGTPPLSIIHYPLSTIHGCDSVITLQLTVNEKPAAPTLTTTDNTTCSETGNGSITVTSPLGNEYEYSIDGRNYQATTSFNYLQEGSYTIYIRYTETGCSNSTTVSIGTTMTYPAANITTNSPLCEGTTLILSGEGSDSGENIAYAWAGPDNFFSTLLNPTGIENATTANAGTYTLTVTNTATNCNNTAVTIVYINENSTGTDNVTICQSELPYYYAPTDTTFQVGTPTLSIIHYPLSTIHGCDSIVTLHLTVNPTYAITDNVTICQSELPYYYAPADTTFQVGTPPLSIIHYPLSTIHGCDSVITLQLTVNEKPAAPTLTTTDNTTCSETGNGSITVTSPLGNEYEYSIDGRNYQATTSFNYLQEGSYTIYIRYTETGCSNSTTVSIGTTMTYPAANITTNSPLCEGTTLTLSGEGSASGENIAYAWAGPDNFFSTLLNPTCIENTTTANAGTYTLTVTNTATNCNNTAVTTVYINENSTGTDNVTICQSELPYYYAPTDTTFQVGTPPLSIIHYPLSTIHGCDSIVTLHLTVNPTYAITD
ncbi:MAG: hypothetical protein PHF76_09860, partial [Bacteroidales bacterium]|nr:hypothetical protein [Bacteroidales bacterium]